MWFLALWGKGRKTQRWTKKRTFWDDQKDEILISLVFSLCFVVFDDEALQAFYYVKEVLIEDAEEIGWEPPREELPTFMYLLIMPIGERIYTWTWGRDPE